MPPPIAIEAHNLVKEYKIYRRPADVLWELVSRRPRHQRHRALDNVSFAIRRGEVVGIIGRNGAGKSTLLKVLTGVLDHDGGTVAIQGNVSAILELGVGLNPEYSGRENILFGCICRGMSLREAEAKFDQIVDFAELNSHEAWPCVSNPRMLREGQDRSTLERGARTVFVANSRPPRMVFPLDEGTVCCCCARYEIDGYIFYGE